MAGMERFLRVLSDHDSQLRSILQNTRGAYGSLKHGYKSFRNILKYKTLLILTHRPVEVPMGHTISQNLEIIHGKTRDSILHDSVVSWAHGSSERRQGDQVEVIPKENINFGNYKNIRKRL